MNGRMGAAAATTPAGATGSGSGTINGGLASGDTPRASTPSSRPSAGSRGSTGTGGPSTGTGGPSSAGATAGSFWASPSAASPWFVPSSGSEEGDTTTGASGSRESTMDGTAGSTADGWWESLPPEQRGGGGRASGGEELLLPGGGSAASAGAGDSRGGRRSSSRQRLRELLRRRRRRRSTSAEPAGDDAPAGGGGGSSKTLHGGQGAPPPLPPAPPATTIPAAVLAAATADPHAIAFILPDDTKVRARAYVKRIRGVAAGLVALGVAPGQAVAVLGANSVEWRVAHLGASFAGAVAVGVHPAASPSALVAALTATAAVVLFVDAARVGAVMDLGPALPLVHTVVVWGGRTSPPHPWLLHWDGLLHRGAETMLWPPGGAAGPAAPRSAADEVAARVDAAVPAAPAAVAFTSGTGAPSRGVVLTHDNIVAVVRGFGERLGAAGGANRHGERIGVSFLPLGHVLPLLVDVYGAALLGIVMNTIDNTIEAPAAGAARGVDPPTNGGGRGVALREGAGTPSPVAIGQLLREVRPTYLVAPPYVLEAMHDAVKPWLSDVTRTPASVVSAAALAGTRASAADAAASAGGSARGGGGSSLTLALADRFLLSKIRGGLGLDACAALFVSAAPLRADTAAFFASIHRPALNVYGLTETTGPVAGHTPGDFSLSTAAAGHLLPGVEVRIARRGFGGVGEILVRGRSVALGYASGPVGGVGGGPDHGAALDGGRVGTPPVPSWTADGWGATPTGRGRFPGRGVGPMPHGVGDSPMATLPPAQSSVRSLLAAASLSDTPPSNGRGWGGGGEDADDLPPLLPAGGSTGGISRHSTPPGPVPAVAGPPLGFVVTPLPRTADGYFPTGDLGKRAPDGSLIVTDRAKAVLVLSSGAKVPPAPVELALRSALPGVEHALLVTDARGARLGVLFALKTKAAGGAVPRGARTALLLDDPAAAVSSRTSTPGEAATGDGLWAAYLQAGIDEVNASAEAMPSGAAISAWAIAEGGFAVSRSEMTPTRKLRRSVLEEHYGGVIRQMFAETRGGESTL